MKHFFAQDCDASGGRYIDRFLFCIWGQQTIKGLVGYIIEDHDVVV